MKALITLLTAALAVSGCSSLTGPEDQDDAAQAAKAKQRLEAASPEIKPSTRLVGN
jgi:PBP1b-binding outer membrane lipoprotein LpoB